MASRKKTRTSRFLSACLTLALLLPCLSAAALAWEHAPGQGGGDYRRVYLIPQAHVDTAWEWPYQTTAGFIVPDTFGRAVDALRADQNHTFTMSASKHYEWFREYGSAAQWKQMRDFIDEGRWDILGGQVVECDNLYPSGESLVRQSLYGQHYFQREFGKMAVVGYLPDDFGHSGSLPQILKKSGMDYFAHARGGTVVSPLYVWEGIDGSELLAYDIQFGSWYANNGLGLNIDDQAKKVYGDEKNIRYSPMMFGKGDHGGGPNKGSRLDELFDNKGSTFRWAIEDAGENNPGRDIQYATLTEYFEDIIADAKLYGGEPDLQTRLRGLGMTQQGELYLGHWSMGCYSSWSRIKRDNRQLELLAESAEKAAAMARWMGSDNGCESIAAAWDRILTNQFHDVLPGTAAPYVYYEAFNRNELARNLLTNTQSSALAAMAVKADTSVSGVPVFVYNHLSWARDGEVTVDVNFPSAAPQNIQVLYGSQEMPCAILHRDGNTATIRFIAQDVPSMGYKVFNAVEGTPAYALPLTVSADPGSDWVVENEHLKLTINHETGYIKSLINKGDGNRETFAQDAGTEAAELHVYSYENPGRDSGASAWSVSGRDINKDPSIFFDQEAAMELVEASGENVTVKVTKRWGDSLVSQYYTMLPGIDRVDVRMEIDWSAPEHMLKVSFPIAADASEASYEAAYGAASHTTRRAGDQSVFPMGEDKRFEQVGHKWMDITDDSGTHGVGILNDAKYGYDVWHKGDFVRARITVVHCTRSHTLRSDEPAYNGPESVYMDLGLQAFNYSIYPHAGSWQDANTAQKAYELCSPMPAFQAAKSNGALGAAGSFMGVNKDNVIIGAVKNPYDGPGDDSGDANTLIVRLYESAGRAADGVELTMPANVLSAEEVDLLEHAYPQGRGSVDFSGKTIRLGSVGRYEIVTLRVQLDGGNPSTPPAQEQVKLPYNLKGTSSNRSRLRSRGLDGRGNFIPQELWPEGTINYNGIAFDPGPENCDNFVEARGQTVELPRGNYSRLYLLGAAADGESGLTIGGRYTVSRNRAAGTFLLNYADGVSSPYEIVFAGWLCDLSGWDPMANAEIYAAVDDPVGHVFTHFHGPDRDKSILGKLIDFLLDYIYYPLEDLLTGVYHGGGVNKLDRASVDNYLFVYTIDLDEGRILENIQLPDAPGIKIAAITAVNEPRL